MIGEALRCQSVRIDPAENGWLATLVTSETHTCYVFQRWTDVLVFLAALDVCLMLRPLMAPSSGGNMPPGAYDTRG